MKYRIFISSVQREFATERKLLADYIRKDAILSKFFEVFIFEEVPAQERSPADVYLSEVDKCDLYLGLLGASYGNTDKKGVSATEREYERAEKKHKDRICFVKHVEGGRDEREAAFVARVNAERTRRGFANWDELRTGVYAALANYLESKDLINVLPFDSAKTANVQLKDLGAGKVRNFILDAREKRSFKLSSRASVMDVLTALELVDDAGRICNSAALLFGKRPQRFFPTSEVKCAWFFGDHVEKPMADYQIYEGDVFELADQATAFVMSHIARQIGTHETNSAPTTFELPRDAVFEGIVNAICHRDYTSNASVQVMLFCDRLEILSPGKLPKGMTISLLHRRHRSIPVNPLLARGMFYRGYIEKVGSGTGDMLDKCRAAGTPAPEWIEEDDGFTVVLRRTNVTRLQDGANGHSAQGLVAGASQGLVAGASQGTAKIICALAHGEGPMSSTEIACRLGRDKANSYIKRLISSSIDEGAIEPTGERKKGARLQKYRLTQSGQSLVAELMKRGRG